MCIVGFQFPASDRTMLKNYKMLVTCNEKFKKPDDSLSKRYFNLCNRDDNFIFIANRVESIYGRIFSFKLQNSRILDIVLQRRASSSVGTSVYQIRYLHRKHRSIELDR